jgi:serine/threonine-protein kinase
VQSPRTRRHTLRHQTLAGYEIVAKIKSGGMAALYLGRKTGAGGFAKYVAIKVILDHMAEEPTLVAMFLDEARLSARIEHPNVVHIHELGEEDDKHFLVMEYVAGCSLAQLQRAVMKRARRLTPAVVAYVGMQVAAGLHAAHEAVDDDGVLLHVVHRDVSPKNILIAYKGYVKLIDFGIAKVRDASQSTSAGSLKGTIRYMSPEQAAGRNVDRRSDVFSLGIVLWEMLTGRPLFQAENELAALDMVRSAAVPPPSHFAPIPPALEQVVMRMLRASPDERFTTTDEVQRALAAAVPESLSFSPQRLGELVSALLPAPSDADIDPSIVSALGRPLPLHDADEVLGRLAIPLDLPSSETAEPTSGVSGAVPRGWGQPASLTPVPLGASDPGLFVSSPGTGQTGQLSPVRSGTGMTGSGMTGSGMTGTGMTGTGMTGTGTQLPTWAWVAPLALVVLGGIAAAAAWSMAGSGAEQATTVPAVPTAPATAPAAVVEAAAVEAPTPSEPAAGTQGVEAAPASQEPDVPGRAARPRAGARRGHEGSAGASGGSASATGSAPGSATGEPAGEPERGTSTIVGRRRPDTHVTERPVISTEF